MKLIVASDPDGGIGYNNKLPWSNLQGDLPRFKKLTSGKIVVMGRNTWDSLPVKPLPNRANYVVTSKPYSLPYKSGLYGIADLATLSHFNDNACIIGGARLINTAWHLITAVHLSRTFTKYPCDTFIDLLQLPKEFSLTYEEVNPGYTYEIWNRK
jgi:dihydrofolate reductase